MGRCVQRPGLLVERHACDLDLGEPGGCRPPVPVEGAGLPRRIGEHVEVRGHVDRARRGVTCDARHRQVSDRAGAVVDVRPRRGVRGRVVVDLEHVARRGRRVRVVAAVREPRPVRVRRVDGDARDEPARCGGRGAVDPPVGDRGRGSVGVLRDEHPPRSRGRPQGGVVGSGSRDRDDIAAGPVAAVLRRGQVTRRAGAAVAGRVAERREVTAARPVRRTS